MRQNVVFEDVYSPAYDIRRLSNTQIADYKNHKLVNFPVLASVILHFVTLGIFDVIYYGAMHAKLPFIRNDDPTQAQAISYWFIPFFDFYWGIFVHARLVDRINFQFRLRNQPPPVLKGLFIVAHSFFLGSLLFFLAGSLLLDIELFGIAILGTGIAFFTLSFCILYPVALGILQANCNKLANEDLNFDKIRIKPTVKIY